jgi:hypothetical protein
LLNAIRLRMQFVRSIPFYPFRALCWYAVMRGRMANRPIQQRYPWLLQKIALKRLHQIPMGCHQFSGQPG